jgi:hypothetical protein
MLTNKINLELVEKGELEKVETDSDHSDLKWIIKNLKKAVRFLKEYLAVFLIVPTVVGGLSQIFSLISININYIRFFSASQLISDGLLILISLVFILILPVGSYWVANLFTKDLLKIIPKRKDLIIVSIFFLVSLVSLLYITILYIILYLGSIFKFPISSAIELRVFILIPCLIIIFYRTGKAIRNYLKKIIRNNKENKRSIKIESVKGLFRFIDTFSGILLLNSIITGIIIYVKVIFSLADGSLPSDLVNRGNIDRILIEEYNVSKENYEVVYFNDTYIFVEHYTVSKSEVEELNQNSLRVPYEVIILKMDDLFKSENNFE